MTLEPNDYTKIINIIMLAAGLILVTIILIGCGDTVITDKDLIVHTTTTTQEVIDDNSYSNCVNLQYGICKEASPIQDENDHEEFAKNVMHCNSVATNTCDSLNNGN